LDSLLSKQPEYQCQQQTDDDHRRDWNVKPKVRLGNYYITWKLSNWKLNQPWPEQSGK
jgi:hypothetical protein